MKYKQPRPGPMDVCQSDDGKTMALLSDRDKDANPGITKLYLDFLSGSNALKT